MTGPGNIDSALARLDQAVGRLEAALAARSASDRQSAARQLDEMHGIVDDLLAHLRAALGTTAEDADRPRHG